MTCEWPTAGNGRYELVELLYGNRIEGLWRALDRQSSEARLMASTRYGFTLGPEASDCLRFEVPGIARAVFMGTPDHTVIRENIDPELVVIETRPLGVRLVDASQLSPNELIRIGIGLCDTVIGWVQRAPISFGLTPETIFVHGAVGSRFYSGATRRAALLLYGPSLGCSLASSAYYPPSSESWSMDIQLADEVFVLGLILWHAAMHKHPYRFDGSSEGIVENMWNDRRHTFTGDRAIGRLLEQVLVADVAKRMRADELRHELASLAKARNIDLPPFPPPGLAEAGQS